MNTIRQQQQQLQRLQQAATLAEQKAKVRKVCHPINELIAYAVCYFSSTVLNLSDQQTLGS